MAGETTLTLIGNLVADPELRFTPAGAAVCSFRMASTPRYLDKATNEWKDGEGIFLTVNCWRQMAENVAESLSKGTRVIVQGRLKQRSYETREGEKRTVMEIEADEVGPALSRNTAKVNRANRDGGGSFGGGGGGGQQSGGNSWSGGGGGGQQSGGAPAGGGNSNSYSNTNGGGGLRSNGPANDDPWSSPAPGGFSDEPPF